jgi:tetratricopeptide (TPR) repeat protein
MQPHESRSEHLHQEASSAYLQGEFEQALSVWRTLLQMNPEDERAKEGVRLCELLTQDDGTTTVAAESGERGAGSIAPESAFGSSAEGFDDDLEELEEVLESGGEGNAESAAAASEPEAQDAADPAEEVANFSFDFTGLPDQQASGPQNTEQPVEAAPSTEVPSPDRQAEGIDFGNIEETETLSLGDGAEAGAESPAQSQQVDQPTSADSAEAAASELRSRVNELLAEALTNYEQGRKEEALGILNRVFILDENNSAALALHDNICAELDAAQGVTDPAEATAEQPPAEAAGADSADAEAAGAASADDAIAHEPVEPDENLDDLEALSLGTPADGSAAECHQQAQAGEADTAPAGDFGDSGDAAETTGESPDDFADELPSTPTIAEAGEQRRKSGGGLKPTRQNVVLIAVLVAVVATGGGLAFFFLGGDGEGSETGGDVAVAGGGGPTLPLPGGAASEGEAPEELDPAQAQVPAEPMPLDAAGMAEFEELMADAQAAFEQQDYASAVLKLKAALDLDPSNYDARDLLAEAGDLYREQKELDARRREAIDAFNEGSYRSALTIFYRLPDGEDREALNRYKRNGWYNMGIQALQAGDCNSAVDHFKEASGLDPDDHEIKLAVDLARSCRYSRGDSAFHEEVRLLPYRGLDD